MFHSARTLLFRDGIIEKSHYCLIQYLRENHSKTLPAKLITIMDSFRISRHEVMYGLNTAQTTKEDIKTAIENAGQMIKLISALIKKE